MLAGTSSRPVVHVGLPLSPCVGLLALSGVVGSLVWLVWGVSRHKVWSSSFGVLHVQDSIATPSHNTTDLAW